MLASGCLSAKSTSFRLQPIKAKQHRKQAAGGSLFFGFFLLATQKKETRQSGETDKLTSLELRGQTSCPPYRAGAVG
jgi:hypothetical protein